MKIYFWCAGIFGLIYYFVLVFYSGKWNSTFSGFWLAAGGVHFLLGCVPLSFQAHPLILTLYLCGCAVFLAVEIKIVHAMKFSYTGKLDFLIVLGAQVRGRRITNSLQRRIDRAAAYLIEHPDTEVVVSGGRGKGEEISEAEAMALDLVRQGIPRDRIYLEDQSTSTRENLRYSRQFLKPDIHRVGIVTNDFHLYRALQTGRQEGYKNLYGIAASSNPIFQLNYLVREFFAVLALWCAGRLYTRKKGESL